MGNEALKIADRKLVTFQDMAIFLMLGEFFTTKSMLPDGSMPWVRFQKFWQCLFEAGDVDRPFQPNRYRAIQNLLTDKGLIDWADSSYCPPVKINGEKVMAGQSMKWQLGEDCLEMLTEATLQREEKVSLVTTGKNKGFIDFSQPRIRPQMILNFQKFADAKAKHDLAALLEWERQQQALELLHLA